MITINNVRVAAKSIPSLKTKIKRGFIQASNDHIVAQHFRNGTVVKYKIEKRLVNTVGRKTLTSNRKAGNTFRIVLHSIN